MKHQRMVIVGLGLMGSSLALALRKKKLFHVTGVSRSAAKIRTALARHIIHEGTTSLARGVRHADIIVIATPVRTIPALVAAVDRFAPKGAVVTDVGSTKEEILKAVNKKKLRRIVFVGAHPMCGSHETGLDFADAQLYRGATVFLIKDRKNSPAAFRTVARLWSSVGGKNVVIDAATHDRVVAEISQFPHLVAVELVRAASKQAFPFSASGFRDATRIAQGDPELWCDIVLSNRKNLIAGLMRYQKQLQQLAIVLRRGDRPGIYQKLRAASRRRRKLSDR